MSEILGDTGKRVSGGHALLLCICHECGSNFEIQRRRFSQLKPCLRCLRKKQKAYEPFYAKIEELEHKLELAKNEIDKLKYELSCHKIIKKMRKERPFDDE